MSSSPFDWLLGLQRFGIKLGLDQVLELLAAVGNPHARLSFVHLAGTNGKGSVGALLSAGFTAAGCRCGFYSSPHLVAVTERFRMDGKAIAETDLARLIERLRPAADRMAAVGRCPTYFEVTTVLAAMHFADCGAEIVVWETGMGGRFDATNVVTPLASVITGIGLDHMAHLGTTEAAIAGEKAGIIKPGVPVFCAPLGEAAQTVMVETAARNGAALHQVSEPCQLLAEDLAGLRHVTFLGHTFPLALSGAIQLWNAALAATVLAYLGPRLGIRLETALAGFGRVRWPGRRQTLADGTVVDGAHNPPAMAALAAELPGAFPGERFALVFGCLADKDATDTLRHLVPLASAACFVPVPGGGRAAADPVALADLWRRLGGVAPTCAELPDALAGPCCGRRLVTGSLYLAGAALARYGMADALLDIH
jgi:dihydrofolate synthase/folylpolyglutamate synthase